MDIDLSVEKDRRNNGYHFRKAPSGLDITTARSQAAKDITEECGEDKYFSRNYVNIESVVVSMQLRDFKN